MTGIRETKADLRAIRGDLRLIEVDLKATSRAISGLRSDVRQARWLALLLMASVLGGVILEVWLAHSLDARLGAVDVQLGRVEAALRE